MGAACGARHQRWPQASQRMFGGSAPEAGASAESWSACGSSCDAASIGVTRSEEHRGQWWRLGPGRAVMSILTLGHRVTAPLIATIDAVTVRVVETYETAAELDPPALLALEHLG